GYHQFDSSHKPVSHFIQLLASAASRGGNLLMNIGPKGDGSFDEKDQQILNGVGDWLQKNGESIYGTEAGPLPYHSWGVSTVKKDKLYLHVFDWPTDGKLFVSGSVQISNGYVLADLTQKIKVNKLANGDLQLDIPTNTPDKNNTVIVFDYKGKLYPDSSHFITNNTMKERFLAFDANQHGKGFSFGDGKTNRYYLDGWKTKSQSVSWQFRTGNDAPAKFKIVVRYLAMQETNGGSFVVVVDQLQSNKSKELYHSLHGVSTDARNVIIQEVGNISLGAGTFRLSIQPATIDKQELMKLLEVELIPIDK
ncbi:MAG TPA: alpha-L-fucosidase, partial [Lacibacter sp.]|nr:alpha-L-fucosidase [Lacibacter sp.]